MQWFDSLLIYSITEPRFPPPKKYNSNQCLFQKIRTESCQLGSHHGSVDLYLLAA